MLLDRKNNKNPALNPMAKMRLVITYDKTIGSLINLSEKKFNYKKENAELTALFLQIQSFNDLFNDNLDLVQSENPLFSNNNPEEILSSLEKITNAHKILFQKRIHREKSKDDSTIKTSAFVGGLGSIGLTSLTVTAAETLTTMLHPLVFVAFFLPFLATQCGASIAKAQNILDMQRNYEKGLEILYNFKKCTEVIFNKTSLETYKTEQEDYHSIINGFLEIVSNSTGIQAIQKRLKKDPPLNGPSLFKAIQEILQERKDIHQTRIYTLFCSARDKRIENIYTLFTTFNAPLDWDSKADRNKLIESLAMLGKKISFLQLHEQFRPGQSHKIK